MYRYWLILATLLLAVTGCYADVGEAIPQFRAEPTPGLKLALLVGVKDYDPNGGVMPLKYADQDMQRLKVVLEKHGYIVRVLVNAEATRNAVLGALETFKDTLADELANSTVLFAFSGHGFAEDQRNFLLTYDTYRNNVQKTGLPLDEVLDALKKSKAQRQLVWIDACRTWVDGDGRRALNSPNFRPQEAEGLAIMFSSKAGTPSYEDDKLQSGVFSHYLLEGLTGANGQTTDADGWIDMAKLQTYVTKQVKSYGFMVGKSQKPYIAGEYSDTFYLGRVAVTPTTPTPITPPVVVTPPDPQHQDQLRVEQERAEQTRKQQEADAAALAKLLEQNAAAEARAAELKRQREAEEAKAEQLRQQQEAESARLAELRTQPQQQQDFEPVSASITNGTLATDPKKHTRTQLDDWLFGRATTQSSTISTENKRTKLDDWLFGRATTQSGTTSTENKRTELDDWLFGRATTQSGTTSTENKRTKLDDWLFGRRTMQ